MLDFEHAHGRLYLIALFLGLCAGVVGSPAGALGEGLCWDATPVDLNATVRGFAADEEPSRLRLEVTTPGVVTLEVTAAVSPRIGVLPGSDDLIVLEQSATHLAFAVRRPGSVCVRLAAQDPRRPLGAYKLSAHFVEAEVRDQAAAERGWLRAAETTFYASGIRAKDEDHEVDPDPSRVELDRRPLVSLLTLTAAAAFKDEDHEVDPDPVRVDLGPGRILARVVLLHGGEVDPDPVRAEIEPQRRWTALVTFPAEFAAKDEDHEVDPDPVRVRLEPGRRIRFAAVDGAPFRAGTAEERAALVTWIAGRIWPELRVAGEGFQLLADGSLAEAPLLRPELGERCRGGEPDDHGDTFACATPVVLGRRISAELGNGWGDDEDVYRFRLSELATVVVEAAGEGDWAIALYDRFGQRLETAGVGGGGARVIRTLSPGGYFVRVAGGGPGSYELTAASMSW